MASPILEAQAAQAAANPNIVSELATGSPPPAMTPPPAATAPAQTMPAVPTGGQGAAQAALDMSNQLYGTGMVSGLETQRNSMMQELYDYDRLLDKSYGGYSPYPQTPGYVENPADRVGALANIAGMTGSNIGRVAASVDTTERAYQMAVSSVMDKFMQMMQLQQDQQQFREQMDLEKEKLRASGKAGTDADRIKATLGMVGWGGEMPAPDADLTVAGATTPTTTNKFSKQMYQTALRSDPGNAPYYKMLYEEFGGDDAGFNEVQLTKANPLRQEYDKKTEGFSEMMRAYRDAQVATNDATGDQALIYAYAKALDPRSLITSRETESIAAAKGMPEWVVTAYKKTLQGRDLNQKQRQRIRENLENRYLSSLGEYKSLVKTYYDLALKIGAPPELVITDQYGKEYGLALLNEEPTYAGAQPGDVNAPSPENILQQGKGFTPKGEEVNMWDFVEGGGTPPPAEKEKKIIDSGLSMGGNSLLRSLLGGGA